MMQKPKQKLLFILGKGGVGRSAAAAGLAKAFALDGEKVLVVQWSVHDSVSTCFASSALAGHDAAEVQPGISVMNFSPTEAIREYFVDHLKMKLLHNMVIENRHVQRFIAAAPGVHELFFLGRLFWLTCLAEEERGWSYDRIIVDAPATGHGMSLFRIAPTIASMGMTGPLAVECERVTKLLYDAEQVGTVVVTIPEELPIEETLEHLPRIQADLGRAPLFVLLNRSFPKDFDEAQVSAVSSLMETAEARAACLQMGKDLQKRERFAEQLAEGLRDAETPIVRVLDVHLVKPQVTPDEVCAEIARELLIAFQGKEIGKAATGEEASHSIPSELRK